MSVHFERVRREDGIVDDDAWVAKAGRVPTVIAHIKRSGPGVAFVGFVGTDERGNTPNNLTLSTVEIVSLGVRLIADRVKEENFTLKYTPVEGLNEIRKALGKPDEEFLVFMRGVRAGMKL